MSAKPELVPPTPPADPNADWTAREKAFFEKHGITDEKEKQAIRGRARVHLYARERQKFEDTQGKPPEKTDTPWYDED